MVSGDGSRFQVVIIVVKQKHAVKKTRHHKKSVILHETYMSSICRPVKNSWTVPLTFASDVNRGYKIQRYQTWRSVRRVYRWKMLLLLLPLLLLTVPGSHAAKSSESDVGNKLFYLDGNLGKVYLGNFFKKCHWVLLNIFASKIFIFSWKKR